jgi:hypothetical protein
MGQDRLGRVRTLTFPWTSSALLWLLLLLGLWRPVNGLGLVLGPHPYLLNQRESCRSVESWRLFALVAELDRPGRGRQPR